MNNVHLVTQEKKPSRKTRLKTKPGARAPNCPSPCAQAACPAPRPCAPRLLPGKIRARPVHPRACHPRALPRARASACAPAAPCNAPVPAACAPSAPPAPACTPRARPAPLPSACSSSHNTILYCDTIWPPAAIPATIQ